MSNLKFKNALNLIEQDVPPIWFMRQAGRYHSHYQSLRKKHSFKDMCKNPKLAAEVALGPIEEFDFDVAILFSDILFPLEALGMGLEYNPGPQLSFQINEENIVHLKPLGEAISFLNFQGEALKETRALLPKNKSLIGFIGGPWTLFTYAIEGCHDGHMIQAKNKWALVPHFNQLLLPLLEKNIDLQLQSGAEVVIIFDTSSGQLSPQFFRQCAFPGLEYLSQRFPKKLGYYSKWCSHKVLEALKNLPFAGFGVDHRFSLPEMLKQEHCGFLQGNFDQSLLFLSNEEFRRQLETYLTPFLNLSKFQRRGWICGLGHGILPQTPEQNVKDFVKIMREVFA